MKRQKRCSKWLRDKFSGAQGFLGGWKNTLDHPFGFLAGALLFSMLTGIGTCRRIYGARKGNWRLYWWAG